MATKKTAITIAGVGITCVYSYSVTKSNDIDSAESESGDEILYLYRTDVYTLDVAFKCNADTGRALDTAISSSVLLQVAFEDMGQTISRIMRVTSYTYRCITLYGKEFWDISLNLKESAR